MNIAIYKCLEDYFNCSKEEIFVKKINKGFTNDLYIINNKYILKCYSDVERYNSEYSFYLSNANNKYIPRLLFSNTDLLIMLIEKIDGESLYDCWYLFDERKREDIILELTLFLKTIHSIKDSAYDFENYIVNKLNNYLDAVRNLFDVDSYKKIINKYSYVLCSDSFSLIHGDLHFDNIFLTDSGLKTIDFETSCYGPIDYELDIFLRMCDNPWKYASVDNEKFVIKNDYKNIKGYLKKHYSELFDVAYLDERLIFYDIEATLRLLVKFPNNLELVSLVKYLFLKLDNKHIKLLESLNFDCYDFILDAGSGKSSLSFLTNKFDCMIDAIVYPGDNRKIESIKENISSSNYNLIECDIISENIDKSYDLVLSHLLLGEASKYGNDLVVLLDSLLKIKSKEYIIIDILEDPLIDCRLIEEYLKKNDKVFTKQIILASEEEKYDEFIFKNFVIYIIR